MYILKTPNFTHFYTKMKIKNKKNENNEKKWKKMKKNEKKHKKTQKKINTIRIFQNQIFEKH